MSGGYDPDLRRDTPLAIRIKDLIRTRGPLPIEGFIEICLTDPEHGYYRRRQVIGATADFITAPEISQVFGELVGLWVAVVWQQMGRPARLTLLEIGPGRGTMMADALRAAARVPGFFDALALVLREPSEVLREVQAATLAAYPKSIHYLDLDEPLPDGPLIVLANEVLDCVPVRQRVRGDVGAWRERVVTADAAGRLQFGTGERITLDRDARSRVDSAPVGSIIEDRNVRGLTRQLLRISGEGGPVAALFVDYGHVESGVGDTLQAVRAHKPEHPLTSPGEADLTAQVDFAAFAQTILDESDRAGAALAIDGPITQAELLGRLGIVERTSRLMAANPSEAGAIEAGVARLMSPSGMGTRFKAIGLRSTHLPILPGFEGAPS